MWQVTIALTTSPTAGVATVTDEETGFMYSGPVDSGDPVATASFVAAAQASLATQIQTAKQTSSAQAALFTAFNGTGVTQQVHLQ